MEQTEIRLLLGDKWEGDNYLFIQWNGKLIHPTTPYHKLKDIIDKYNNTLRFKTYISYIVNISPHSIKTVSARLGHPQTSTTMNIYAQSFKKLDEVAADTLGDMLKAK